MLNPMLDAWTSLACTSPWDSAPIRFGISLLAPLPEPGPGDFVSDRFAADFGSLRYKLFIPSGYDGSPTPLIVMLHGCGQDADDFACGTGMNALAEKYHCLVAYPEQSCGANGAKCWNWFEKANHHRGQGEPALIAGVARKIISEYAVDTGKVFVAGLSSGGSMAVILGRTYPDLFTAVGCHSGLAHGAATDRFGAMRAMRHGADVDALDGMAAADGVPIIVFHGDLDSTVHPRNGGRIVRQSLQSATAAQTHAQEVGEATGRTFTRDIHRSATGDIFAEHWTVHGAGHAWSGGSRRGSYTDANGPDASEQMLRFFFDRQAA
ncbi:PHB depolymerase family esterase [Massilia sp. R2A-15]|uniref:extracellular catalytic domain type 1 short-chain-length polyhydroxyalkanoate depolymerase n=1 Tax=Massilia sp. R2A-15 TaxID=3064278 RepID=UPI0027328929|nr:PHB depolymerase family esterase [Massilia sp. R2A-15]WLI87405.1 PHB depolymerase family esterase [Massilia sp. R2A-15]